MAEPTSTTGAAGAALVAIGVSMVGARFGPFVTVAAAAFIGTLISLGEVQTPGRRAAAWYVVRYVLMATILSGSLSYLIERASGVAAVEVLALVAFCIGWIGNRWKDLMAAVVGAVQVFVGRKGSGQ